MPTTQHQGQQGPYNPSQWQTPPKPKSDLHIVLHPTDSDVALITDNANALLRGVQRSNGKELWIVTGFKFPGALCVSPDGRRAFVVDNRFVFCIELGLNGRSSGPGKLNKIAEVQSACGIAYSAQLKRLYVSSNSEHSVHVFDEPAAPTPAAEGGDDEQRGGAMWQRVAQWGETGPGSGPRQFKNPSGLTVDSSGLTLFVCDQTNDRIQAINAQTGNFIREYGGKRMKELKQPTCVAVSDTHLCAADSSNRYVVAFDIATTTFLGMSATFSFSPKSVCADGTVAGSAGGLIVLPVATDPSKLTATATCVKRGQNIGAVPFVPQTMKQTVAAPPLPMPTQLPQQTAVLPPQFPGFHIPMPMIAPPFAPLSHILGLAHPPQMPLPQQQPPLAVTQPNVNVNAGIRPIFPIVGNLMHSNNTATNTSNNNISHNAASMNVNGGSMSAMSSSFKPPFPAATDAASTSNGDAAKAEANNRQCAANKPAVPVGKYITPSLREKHTDPSNSSISSAEKSTTISDFDASSSMTGKSRLNQELIHAAVAKAVAEETAALQEKLQGMYQETEALSSKVAELTIQLSVAQQDAIKAKQLQKATEKAMKYQLELANEVRQHLRRTLLNTVAGIAVPAKPARLVALEQQELARESVVDDSSEPGTAPQTSLPADFETTAVPLVLESPTKASQPAAANPQVGLQQANAVA